VIWVSLLMRIACFLGQCDWTSCVLCVRKLEDSEAAEHYCAELGRPEVYMQWVACLLSWCLDAQSFINFLDAQSFINFITSLGSIWWMHVVCFSDLILIAEIRQFMTLLCLTQTCVPTVSICSCLCRLLDMYLKPGEGREPMHGAAVRLLHCHGASLDPLQVLEVCFQNITNSLSAISIRCLRVGMQCITNLTAVIWLLHPLPLFIKKLAIQMQLPVLSWEDVV
jgi:hypothetical protein